VLSAENIATIRSEGRRLARFAWEGPGCEVQQYPGWSLADLASHVGSILGRTARICREASQEKVSAPRLPEGRDPIDWYEQVLDDTLEALTEADPETRVWTFDAEGKLGFWERRMVVEVGVHRWDAQRALGEPDPLTDRVATLGLGEVEPLWLQHLGDVQTLEAAAVDLGRSWTYGSGEPSARVEGTGSELVLRILSRPSSVVLPDDWAAAVDGLAPPPKR